jgi:hypothetical protein
MSEEGLREAPGYVAFAHENGTVYRKDEYPDAA